MKKLFFTLIFFPLYLFANQSILIINSYHKGYEFSDSILQGFENKIYNQRNIDINILYMDSKRIASLEYYESLKKLYEVQLKNQKYDLVITLDRFAYDFILENYHSFFTNEPILTLGIENFSLQNAQKYNVQNKVSALLEVRDLKGNVQLIETLMPSIKKLYIVNDKSLSAQHTEPHIQSLIKDFKKKYKLIYLKADSLEQLQNRFSKYEEDSAVLFIKMYKNSNGKLNKNQEIASFIQNAKVPIFITDSIFNKKGAIGGKLIDLNLFGEVSAQMALNILHNNRHEIKVFDAFEYVFDAQKLDQFTIAVDQLSNDYTIVNKRLTFYDKNRGLINFVFTISPILILLIIGLFHNIYMRRHTEDMLRQRIEFDSALLNAIESPIFWQDTQGKIVDSNMKFCQFINLSNAQLCGKMLLEFADNKNVQRMAKALEQYQLHPAQNIHFKHKDEKNQQKTYLIKQACYFDKKTHKSGTVTVFTDITQEQEIEKERSRNQQFIIQQSKLAEIGEVFSSIAHQWKSPLVEITTIAQESFYQQDNTKSINEGESYVSEIMTQVNYMNDTINDFQKFIMPSRQKVNFDVTQAIESIMQIMNHNIKYNYLNITVDIKPNSNVMVYGYRNEFMQSFLNILNNAKDALLKNEFKNRFVDIMISNKKDKVIIQIEDNAGGIQNNTLHKIFKPYFSTKEKGHGIGLYMSKVIIEDKMGGKINAYNTQKGAGFKIILGVANENTRA